MRHLPPKGVCRAFTNKFSQTICPLGGLSGFLPIHSLSYFMKSLVLKADFIKMMSEQKFLFNYLSLLGESLGYQVALPKLAILFWSSQITRWAKCKNKVTIKWFKDKCKYNDMWNKIFLYLQQNKMLKTFSWFRVSQMCRRTTCT